MFDYFTIFLYFVLIWYCFARLITQVGRILGSYKQKYEEVIEGY